MHIKFMQSNVYFMSLERWFVERTFAWISRNRRLARDFERYAITLAAFVRLA
jgi:transposase